MKVLIIEDEILIQKSLEMIFKRRGFSVDTTSSGKEAIQKILHINYDKIICDLMLQDITGFDILEESKRIYSLEEIKSKFVIITAYSSDQILDKAKVYGCPIVNKPFDNIEDIFCYIKE